MMQVVGENHNGRPSISDVAAMAGVSLSTVSNVLSQKRPTAVKTRHRVLEVVKRLNYKPHFAAQALAKGSSMAIGAVVRDISDHYAPIHLKAINEVCNSRGYQLSLVIVDKDRDKMQSCLSGFGNGQAEGVIVLSSQIPDEMVEELADTGYEICTPLRQIPGYESLCPVEVSIAGVFDRLLGYLYGLGHRQFGFISGIPAEVPHRYRRLHRFIADKGLDFSADREITGPDTLEQAEAAADKLLERCPEITALVCSNDVLAVGAMTAAYERGRSVPADLSITGFDDVPISRYCIPRLTTVKMPISELAKISVSNLIDRIEGKEPVPMIKLKPELLIRGTCAVPGRK